MHYIQSYILPSKLEIVYNNGHYGFKPIYYRNYRLSNIEHSHIWLEISLCCYIFFQIAMALAKMGCHVNRRKGQEVSLAVDGSNSK